MDIFQIEKLILKKIVMKKLLSIILSLLIINAISAQSVKLQQEIDEQVWIPFMHSFGTDNNQLFQSVHSKEVVRVVQDQNEIFGYDRYFKKVPDSIKTLWSQWEKKIELRFIQRIASEDKAFEVGYYRTTSHNTKTGQSRKSIGKFHVLLRKENGVWKIYLDADTSNGVTEEDFENAETLKN